MKEKRNCRQRLSIYLHAVVAEARVDEFNEKLMVKTGSLYIVLAQSMKKHLTKYLWEHWLLTGRVFSVYENKKCHIIRKLYWKSDGKDACSNFWFKYKHSQQMHEKIISTVITRHLPSVDLNKIIWFLRKLNKKRDKVCHVDLIKKNTNSRMKSG